MDERARKHLHPVLTDLRRITDGCRDDMHEPDEQGVKVAEVFGDHLDNAMPATPEKCCGEFIFWMESDNEGAWFRLADIIALARRASL